MIRHAEQRDRAEIRELPNLPGRPRAFLQRNRLPSVSLTRFRRGLVGKHDDIAQCARELWIESGRPSNRDEAIWLEAERRLVAARRAPAVIASILPVLSRRRSLRRPI